MNYFDWEFHAKIYKAEKEHQAHIPFRDFCNGCGWTSGFCMCPPSIEAIIKDLERKARGENELQ